MKVDQMYNYSYCRIQDCIIHIRYIFNRPLAATSSCDVIFIKLWATTLRMPEMEKAYRKYHNGQI